MKYWKFCSDLSKQAQSSSLTLKNQKKWPNGQTILFVVNSFKNGPTATLNFIRRRRFSRNFVAKMVNHLQDDQGHPLMTSLGWVSKTL